MNAVYMMWWECVWLLIALYGRYLSQFEILLIPLQRLKHLTHLNPHLSFQLVVYIFPELSIWNDNCVSKPSCASPAKSGKDSLEGHFTSRQVYPMFPWWRQKGWILFFMIFVIFGFSWLNDLYEKTDFMVLNVSKRRLTLPTVESLYILAII